MTNGKIRKHHVVLRLTQDENSQAENPGQLSEETKEEYLTRISKEIHKRGSK